MKNTEDFKSAYPQVMRQINISPESVEYTIPEYDYEPYLGGDSNRIGFGYSQDLGTDVAIASLLTF